MKTRLFEFAGRSIRHKLILLTVAISASSLMLFMAGVAAFQYRNEYKHAAESHETLATVIANSIAPAVAFDDRKTGEETLARLESVPEVDFALAFDDRGARFASYLRQQDVRAASLPDKAIGDAPVFADGRLLVARPILADGRSIGRIVIGVNLDPLWHQIYAMLAIALLLTAVLTLVACALSSMSAKLITGPIYRLYETMRQVTDKQDYSVRVQQLSKDEIGALSNGFNTMLTRIQDRDSELERYRSGLERAVAERTRQLADRNDALTREIDQRVKTERDLVAAKETAEHASQAKSQFLAMMSHEIRTPMNGVLGMTNVLLDTELSDEQRHFGTTIRQSAESLLDIINDVLDFSKLEAEAMEFEHVAFDLHALVRNAIDVVAPRASSKSIVLACEVDPSVPNFVSADPNRIRQILLNLLGNAVKFTERGSVTLKMSLGASGRMRIAVVDTGIGIPADRIDRLFQSFSQVDESISRRFGGTGLGLAISKRLCERMGGTIGVESIPGHGSTFWFEVPFECASAEQAAARARGVDAASVAEALAVINNLGRPLRLLVAEDNPTNQVVVRSTLAKFGIKPDVVDNGLKAVEAVQRQPYDIVLMDMQMPEMDGLEATRTIRSLKAPQATIPIVALTANAFASDVEQCRAAGMNRHVGKPFRPEEVVVAIGKTLAGPSEFTSTAEAPSQKGIKDPVLDISVIEAFRADSGDDMVPLLIETFINDAVGKLDQLSAAAASGGVGGDVVRLVHSLKSAGAMAGAIALSRLAAKLERELSQGAAALGTEDAAAMHELFKGYREALVARGLVAEFSTIQASCG